MKARLAANIGHSKTVAIAADTLDNPMHQLLGLGMVNRPKAQGIHRRNGAGAHGKHIAQNAAYTRRGPLVGLNIRGVVVAFHFKDDRLTIANIDDTGILAWAANDLWASCRQCAKPFFRGFI